LDKILGRLNVQTAFFYFISTFLLNFKTVCFADFAYHACRDSMVGGLVNQNKRALCMVVFVCGSGEF